MNLLLTWSYTQTPDLPSLSGTWDFRYDPQGLGLEETWYATGDDWIDTAAVPGFWSDAAYDGYGWYRISFTLPKTRSEKRMALVFESVDDNAQVWINGLLVGSHEGYGEKFWFEILDAVRFGESNWLVVRIEDTGGPGGINAEVHMDWYDDEQELLTSPLSQLTAAPAPDWVREAVIYEIFVRDFTEEGDFQGVIRKLDELKELGVTCIWLMPIHPIGKEKRKGEWGSPYSVLDYVAVSPDFGTLEDFRDLVKETHKRDMRIIIDMVLNHSAWDCQLMESHPEWYTHNEQGNIIPPNNDWTDVADFDYNSQELRKYMVDMLVYWVRDYDLDGFRFDVAELVPMDFWDTSYDAVRSVKEDVLFLAEGDNPELHVGDFHLTYSWNVWHQVLEVCTGNRPAGDLIQTLIHERYRYPQNSLRLRFVENHDKQRAAREIPPEALRMAHAFIYTIPGVPLLYNGEEVGLDHRLELFGKDPIQWDGGDADFRRFMVSLGKLKHHNEDLSSLEWDSLDENLPEGVLGWRRGQGTMCFANFSAEKKQFDIGSEERDWIREFSVSSEAQIRNGEIVLQPWDLMVIRSHQ